MKNNRELGNMGEEIAAKYLEDNGYEIIARNIHYSRFCELDIIAKQKGTLIFVEVKTRKTDNYGTPFEAITPQKYNNIKKGALKYLENHPSKSFRIDVIGITFQPELKIEHLINI